MNVYRDMVTIKKIAMASENGDQPGPKHQKLEENEQAKPECWKGRMGALLEEAVKIIAGNFVVIQTTVEYIQSDPKKQSARESELDDTAEQAKEEINRIIDDTKEKVKSHLRQLPETEQVEGVGLFKKSFHWIVDLVKKAATALKDFVMGAWEMVKSAAQSIGELVLDTITRIRICFGLISGKEPTEKGMEMMV